MRLIGSSGPEGVAARAGALARQWWQIWLGLGVSLFFLVWAFRQIHDFGSVGLALRGANYLFLAPALGAYFFGVWIRGARWHYLLRPVRSVPAARLFPVVVIGYMANDVLPARLGELVRAYVLGTREGVSKSAALATIVVERTFDGVAMLVFLAAVAALVPLNAWVQGVFLVAALTFAAALLGFFLVASSRGRALSVLDRALRLLPERFRPGIWKVAERFLVGLEVMQSGRLLAATLGLSLAAWLAEAAMYYLVALGFGLGLHPAAYLLTAALANLGGMIPSSPGYIGTFEWFALASLNLFGLGADAAISYVLVLHAALLGPVTLLGFFYLWRYGLSLRSLRSSQVRQRE